MEEEVDGSNGLGPADFEISGSLSSTSVGARLGPKSVQNYMLSRQQAYSLLT